MMNDDLITQILSWLLVESLIRFKCVCRSWNSLISNPSFLKLHFHKSSLRHDLLLTSKTFIMPCTKRDLLITNQHSTLTIVAPPTPSPTHQALIKIKPKYHVTGSCNGLLCLYASTFSLIDCIHRYWIRFWNPAMKLRSKKSPSLFVKFGPHLRLRFGFGNDTSSDTYKVVALFANERGLKIQTKVYTKVYTMGGDSWRDIQDFPGVFPPCIIPSLGSFLSGTLNWIAFRTSVEQLVIVSLDLGKETFGHLLLPSEVVLDVLPIKRLLPTLGVLRDCLCVSHVDKKAATRFVVWKMNKFGDKKSWTQIVNVCYQPLQIQIDMSMTTSDWTMFENGDVLMLKDCAQQGTPLYLPIDIKVDTYLSCGETVKFIYFMDYAQSLVLPYRQFG